MKAQGEGGKVGPVAREPLFQIRDEGSMEYLSMKTTGHWKQLQQQN